MHNKIAKRRLQSSYITTTVSISLVLTIIGIVGFLALNTQRLSTYVKENIGMTIYIKDDAKEVDVKKLQKILDAKPYVKSTELVDKDEAAEMLQKDLGEDFLSFLGKNPLLESINVHFYADYTQVENLSAIQKNLMQYSQVKEVVFQKDLLSLIEKNIQKISFILLAFGILLFLTSYTLINNTIRLSVYSQRHIIRAMKLIGATARFIRHPFLIKSISLGFVSSLVAIFILTALILTLRNEFSELISLNNFGLFGILALGIILSGIVISYLATFFAVSKYLNIKEQKLYY